jgi:protein phosphatase
MRISINNPICLDEIGSRSNQEDSVFPEIGRATVESKIYMVCDGMGGHEHGEVASQTVCQALSDYINHHWEGDFFADDMLNDALHAAISQINKLDDDSVRKPGTTMTFLCLHRGGALAAHIGDSRIYHIRPSKRCILYKSRDHSLVYDLFLSGEITQNEIATYNKKNVLTRAILPNMDREPKADIVHITDIQAGDYFVLCSDGLLENMSDQQLMSLLCSDVSEKEKATSLIRETQANADNHSAYIIQISEVEKEDGDDKYLNDEAVAGCNAILLETEKSDKQQSALRRFFSRIFCKGKNNK